MSKKPNKRRDRTVVADNVQWLRDLKQWSVDTTKDNIEQEKFDKLLQRGIIVTERGGK